MEHLKLRYLLLQVRRADDPMREQEIRCFSRGLQCHPRQIEVLDLIHHAPTVDQLGQADVVLMGGSGDYSVVEGGEWLDRAMRTIVRVHQLRKPTFASCWGFQAIARALGGAVVTDVGRAEVGNYAIHLTAEGQRDPVLGPLASPFLAFEGHQDIVTRLPPDATLLAISESGIFQSFTFPDLPIYCTQFHPELDRQAILERVQQYPEYVERVLGISLAEFAARCQETPEANQVLGRFAQHVLDLNAATS